MTAAITAAEFRATQVKPKKSKYRNIPVEVDGIRFASKAEAARYNVLKLREKAGEIGGLELQRRFPIIVGAGAVVTVYVSDFAYWDHQRDRFVVEDVKGVATPVFRLKQKLMQAVLGIDVEVIKARRKA